MLKKTAIQKFATLLKLDLPKLEAAIADEKEVDVEIAEDLQVFTKPELETRDKNNYKTAKKAGEEMQIKALKEKHGVDIAGEDPEKFIEALQKKIKAEVDTNPDARVAEMQKTLDTAKSALKKVNEEKDLLQKDKETFQYNTKLLSLLPNDRMETMTNEEYLMLLNSAIKIETRDGKEVVLKGGQPIIDAKSLEPVPVADAIKGVFTERKWIKEAASSTQAGRGGGNSNPGGAIGKFTKLSEVKKHIEDQGKNIQGEEGGRMMQAAIKENPGIDMNN